jgi:pimeloyl-ACP methyl ester carboxylesterase
MSAPTKAPPALQSSTPTGDDYGSPGRSQWLDIDWRAHLRSISIDGARVNYVEMGTGAPLVFVHGLSGCWQNWLENIPHFARSHRVIAVDLVGFGESEMPHWQIGVEGYGRFIDAFLGEIGVERAPIVGNSMGGFISAETAISHPSRVEKLVLVDAAGGPTAREWQNRYGSTLSRAARLAAPIIAAGLARSEHLVRRPGLRRLLLYKVAAHPDRLRPELCFEVARGAAKPGFMDALKSIFEYDYLDRIPDISCPTLIVWGAKDEIVPVQDAFEYERLIPGARSVIFEDTGHVPMLERPARFNRVLEEFLAA